MGCREDSLSQRALRLSPRARPFSLLPARCLASSRFCSRSPRQSKGLWPQLVAREGDPGGGSREQGCSVGGGGKMSGEDEQQEQTIAEDLVVTKYKMGGDIANREYGLRSPGI